MSKMFSDMYSVLSVLIQLGMAAQSRKWNGGKVFFPKFLIAITDSHPSMFTTLSYC